MLKGICGSLAIGLLATAALAADPSTAPIAPPPPLPPVPTTAPAPISPAIQAILAAPDPSSAIEAYARGVAADPNDVELEKAYVRHMVDLGAPEMADAQSRDLVKRGAADPLAMGVAAYNDAARGNAPAAVTNLKPALALQPDDPFLLRTAGQIVAWYDGTLDRSNLSKDDVAGIERLRQAGAGRDEFAEAYRMATDARRQNPTADATQPYSDDNTAIAPSPSSPATTPMAPPTTYYYNNTPIDDGYVASGYRYYYPYYAYSYWPSSSIIVVRDCDFHHDHHGHWDGHWDGHGDGHGDGHWDGHSGKWSSHDGIITRPNGWVTRTRDGSMGPMAVNPDSQQRSSGRNSRDNITTFSRTSGSVDGSSAVTAGRSIMGPQPDARSRQQTSVDRGSRGGSSAQRTGRVDGPSPSASPSRSSDAPHGKYDSPAPQAPPRSGSGGGGGGSSSSRSGGGGGGSSRSGGSSSSSSGGGGGGGGGGSSRSGGSSSSSSGHR